MCSIVLPETMYQITRSFLLLQNLFVVKMSVQRNKKMTQLYPRRTFAQSATEGSKAGEKTSS